MSDQLQMTDGMHIIVVLVFVMSSRQAMPLRQAVFLPKNRGSA